MCPAPALTSPADHAIGLRQRAPEIMSLGSLLTIVGIAIAAYSVARPVQRRSLSMFVPVRGVLFALVLPALLVIIDYGLVAFGADIGEIARFLIGAVALGLPVGALVWAARAWHGAVLTKHHETHFIDLARSSLYENSYDELVRVVRRNAGRLHEVATDEMVAMLYDRRVIAALASRRSWIHLQLLAHPGFFERVKEKAGLNHCPREVELVIREYLVAEESPLRLFVVSHEQGDPTASATQEERDLVQRTFGNRGWYARAKVERPLFAVCRELLDSRALDESYNQTDDYYTCPIGLSSRSRCPLYLAEKVMYQGFQQAIQANAPAGTARSEIWWLFMEVHKHSRYRREEWGDPPSEHPTPFAYLMHEVCSDLWDLASEAYSQSDNGDKQPTELICELAKVWAHCVVTLAGDMVETGHHVSPRFATECAEWYLHCLLEWQSLGHDEQGNEIEAPLAWARMLLDSLKEKVRCRQQVAKRLIEVLGGMDLYGRAEGKHESWLESEIRSWGEGA